MSFTHIPAGKSAATFGQSATMLRAMSTKKKVQDVAKTVQAFDQKDGVDLNNEPNTVSVKDASAAVTAGDIMMVVGGNPFAAIPEKVSGIASFGEDGQAKDLDVSVQETLGSAQQVRFKKQEDGTSIYSAPDLLGYVTVREHKDGTLFIATGNEPAKDFESMASENFKAPTEELQTGEKQEGLWRLVPTSTDEMTKAVDDGARKLGGWLSKIAKNL